MLMPRKRLLRIPLMVLSLGALAAVSQATFCSDVKRCAMAGAAEDGVAPLCTPEMGSDCCAEGEDPAGAPSRNDASRISTLTLLATAIETVPPVATLALPSWPADVPAPARLSTTVPLYTLLATLLI